MIDVIKAFLKEESEINRLAKEEAEHIRIHATQGIFPKDLFIKRAPYQTEEEFQYLKCNYKTKSHPVWIRFIGMMSRIWADQNWSVEVPKYENELDNPLIYLYNQYPNYDNIESYFRQVVSVYKHRDANALLSVCPKGLPIIENEAGEYVIDSTQRIEPICKITPSCKVVHYEHNRYALIQLNEKSKVYVGSRQVDEGHIFELYTQTEIIRYVQYGKKSELNFSEVLYWVHDLGYLPAWKLKGVPEELDCGNILYHSFFSGVLAPLDQVLLDNSYLTAIKAGHAFPQKWEYADECDYHNDKGSCINGQVITSDGSSECPKCHGTGRKPGILGVYQIKTPTNIDPTSVATPPFGYVAPDSQILEFLQKQIDLNIDLAFEILNIQKSNSDVDQTALGKLIDREELFSMLMFTSNQLFDLFQNSIKAITQMRYGNDTAYIKVSAPRSFSIRTDADITQEISTAKSSGMPNFIYALLVKEYLQTRFNNTDQVNQIVEFILTIDKLAYYSNAEISQMMLSNSITKKDVILHNSILKIVDEALYQDEDFFEKDFEYKKSYFDAKIAEYETLIAVDEAKKKEGFENIFS